MKVAAAFHGRGWNAEEVELADKPVIICSENETLKAIMDRKDLHWARKPKGKWAIQKPDGWTRIFIFGFDTRAPIETEDYDVVEKFKEIGFKATQIQEENLIPLIPMAVSAVSQFPTQEPIEPAIEGRDKPKGAPMTTYSQPKRGPGRPPKVRPEVKVGA